jgi:hypothetical protein
VVLATSSGILRLLNCNEGGRLDLVPVDCVINTMLMVITNQIINHPTCTIYTSGSYRNPIQLGYYFKRNLENLLKKPLKNGIAEIKSHSKVIDQNPLSTPNNKILDQKKIVPQPPVVIPSLRFIKNKQLFDAMYYINNILPLYWIRDQKTKAKQQRVNRYLDKLYANYTHFTMNHWLFVDDNTKQLELLLSKQDKQAFGYTIMDVDWSSYINDLTNGVREFVNRPRSKL